MTRAAPKLHPLHQRLMELQRTVLPQAAPSPQTATKIRAAEKHLGRPLPPGYRRFLAEIGRTYWPVDIRNLLDHDPNPELPSWFVPFASDGGGNLWGFDRRGLGAEAPIAFWDHEAPALQDAMDDPTPFEEWLQERLDVEQAALRAVKPPEEEQEPIEDPELARAARLVRRLLEEGAVEVARGFSVEEAARAIVDAWDEPEHLLEILEERADVVDLFLSEDELAALQRSLDD